MDEELNRLDDDLRRLIVEYDVYFNGGSKRPPADTDFRVKRSIQRFETQRMPYAQRFRFNPLAQKYGKYADLWRQKVQIKESGYRRPQDALLAIVGLRTQQEREAAEALEGSHRPGEPFKVILGDNGIDERRIAKLYEAMVDAKQAVGENVAANSFDRFLDFVRVKTQMICNQQKVREVEYAVEVEDGRVKLKARAKT